MQLHTRVLLFIASLLLVMVPVLSRAAPSIEVNKGLFVQRGATAIIQPSDLKTSGGYVELQSVPSHGSIRKNGTPLLAGARISQQDIDVGSIVYINDNSANASDSFDIAVRGISRISVSTDHAQSNDYADCGTFSADGRFFVFYSAASTLVPNDTNGQADVFVRDTQLGTTTRISVASDGTQANDHSQCGKISADGRIVAFQSHATNLVSNDTNDRLDVFVRNRDTDNDGVFDEPDAVSTTRISVSSGNIQGNSFSGDPSISADGRFVTFLSPSNNLVAGDTNGKQDIFVRDLQNNTTQLVSIGPNGLANGASDNAVIAAQGRFVAFQSDATNLVAGDTEGFWDIFVRDLQSNTVERISVSTSGMAGNGDSLNATISADGRFVAFESWAGGFVNNDDDTKIDIFVRDRQLGTTTLVSQSSVGLGGNDHSNLPSISADGRYVAFVSQATMLVPDDTNGVQDAFVRDLITGTTKRISFTQHGKEANMNSNDAMIAPDGRNIAFQSDATNIVDGDTNGKGDIFLYEPGPESTVSIGIQNAGPLAVAPLTDLTLLENETSQPMTITISGSGASSAQLSAISSNPTLIPNENIVFADTGNSRTVTIIPAQTNARAAPNRHGEAEITITAANGTTRVMTQFKVIVTPPPWLVMLYLGGDDVKQVPGSNFVSLSDPIRELTLRLKEMPFNPAVRLVVLTDLNDAIPDGGNGDSRIYVRDPSGLTDLTDTLTRPGSSWFGFPTNSELDTGNVSTLRSFVQWARQSYPDSSYTFLSIVDHGGGWAPDFAFLGGQQSAKIRNQAGGWRGIGLDVTNGSSSLSTRDTSAALNGVLGTGRHLDVLFFDACLMGMIENAYQMRDATDYLIAGENQLFAAFPYERYLAHDVLTPKTTPRDFTINIVNHYNDSIDTRLYPFTIAALDVRQLRDDRPDNLATRINTLAGLLLGNLPNSPVMLDHPVREALTEIYRTSQQFDYDNSLTIEDTEGYVDLADFAQGLAHSNNSAISADVKNAARAVVEAIHQGETPVVIRSRHVNGMYNGTNWNFDQATGLAIFLQLGEQDYRPTYIDPKNPEVAVPERQLGYYANTCRDIAVQCEQLAFTQGGRNQSAPKWAQLLLRLEANTPMPKGGSVVSPYQLGVFHTVYLPITVR